MNRTLIYIDEQLVDLLPDTVVASTFKAFEIGDLTSRNASYTNQFKLPKTSTNKRIFGFSDNVSSETSKPYIKLSAKIVQNGIEVIRGGAAVIESVGEYFNVEILAGAFTFFDNIQGRLLTHINFGEGLITWDAAKIDSCRNITTSALIAPFVQYGNIDETGASFDMTATNRMVLPSVRYKNIIEKIITNAGYTASGSIFSDEKFLKLVVSFSKDSFFFSGNFNKNREFIAEKTEIQTSLDPIAGYDVVTFPTVIQQDGYGFFKSATGIYDVSGVSDTRDFHVGFFVELEFTVISGTYRFLLRSSDLDMPSVTTQEFTVGTHRVTFGIDIGNDDLPGFDLSFNSTVEVRVQDIVAGQIDITYGKFYNKVYGYNQQVTNPQFCIEDILPDIEQSVIIKDFAMRFGLMFLEIGSVIECKMINEVIQESASAQDWTVKRTGELDDLNFDFRNYAQRNKFSYGSNDTFYNNIKDAHNGYILVDNLNIEAENNLYESSFFGSTTKRIANTAESIIAGYIPIFEALSINYAHEFDNAPGLRLMLIRDTTSADPNVIYNGTSRNDYGILYFVDPNTAHSMEWQSFIDEYYSGLIKPLQHPKLIKREYNLNVIDIASLDLFKLVYDSGAYYLINTVENFVPGQPTKVQLFKVNTTITGMDENAILMEDDGYLLMEDGSTLFGME